MRLLNKEESSSNELRVEKATKIKKKDARYLRAALIWSLNEFDKKLLIGWQLLYVPFKL